MSDVGYRLLVVGVGNVLQGDDGFGVELAHRLMARTDLPDHIKLMETGIGGMSLIQELMYGYDALLILDAYQNNGEAGQLYLLEPILPDLSGLKPHELRDYFSDTHYATPMRALNFLSRVGQLPKIVNIIGCEPEEIDDMTLGLSEIVKAAIPKAEKMTIDWINRHLQAEAYT
ncbi:MAG TPA: hydrogenase maturation protease [Piscirickettsiaceae bacterium]|jgi:hydrogenase maturation protease|nr:hydrogenase maturation protease [Piscirickettsiaceae bacterium]